MNPEELEKRKFASRIRVETGVRVELKNIIKRKEVIEYQIKMKGREAYEVDGMAVISLKRGEDKKLL